LFDFVPPAVLLVLNLLISVRVIGGRQQVPYPATAVICAVAPLVYAVGALFYLAFNEWAAMLSVAAVGTLAIPIGVLLPLKPTRPTLGVLIALAVTSWVVTWRYRGLMPLPGWNAAEMVVAAYLAVVFGAGVAALTRGWGDGLARRILMVGVLPPITVALLYVLLKSRLTRVPVVSTSILVGAELVLLMLVRERPPAHQRTTPVTLLVELGLLVTGALLLFTFVAKLGAFPQQDPLALAVTVVLAAGIALAYGLLRPQLVGALADAFYPEVQQARARVEELQQELGDAQDRLRRAEQLSLIGQLAAQVAHEIKNPLGPIKGYAKVIERELEKAGVESEAVARGLDVIRQEVESIDARARGLLELGRPPEPELQPVDYVDVAQDVLHLLEGDLPPGVTLGWRVRPELPAPGTSDPMLLRSAITNVVKNALLALEQRGGQGRVELELRPEGEGWSLWVDDDGPGFPPGVEPEELFKPFVSKRQGGTGLGLVIARGALRALGGDLSLTAGEPAGVRAIFSLPGVGAAQPRSLDPVAEPPAAPQPSPAKTSSSAS
jgi:signal transduction histidine kinase